MTTNELYDELCRTLTDYEGNGGSTFEGCSGSESANILYELLVKIQNNWDYINTDDEVNSDIDEYRCVVGSRADFEERGYDTSHLSNKEMEHIFEKIGEILVGYGGYWESIDEWGSDMPHNENYSNEDE